MNLLEFLSALSGAIGELERTVDGCQGLHHEAVERVPDYARRGPVPRLHFGGGDEVMGIARGDFVGLFKPPIGKALFDHVLWVRQALVREAVGRCSLIVGRVAREGALVWVMAGFCSENHDFLVARAGKIARNLEW
jgi:hypothetical protein